MNEELRDVLVAVRSGKEDKARLMLAEYLRRDPDNVPAWLLLSKLATSPVQKAAFLRKVLDIDSDHAYARQALEALGQAPAPVVNATNEPEAPQAPEIGAAPTRVVTEQERPLYDLEEEIAAAEEEEFGETAKQDWSVSEDPADYDAQAAGDSIPPWMPQDETMIETPERLPQPAAAEAAETVEEAEEAEEELPDWLRKDEPDDWLRERETARADADEAAAAERAARLSAAMSQQTPTVVETETDAGRGWLVPLLIVVAVVVFLLLVYVVLTMF